MEAGEAADAIRRRQLISPARAVAAAALAIACAVAIGCTVGARTNARSSGGVDPNVARRISVADVKKHLAAGDSVTVIDVRPVLHGNMADGAEHVPPAMLPRWAKDKPKNSLIIAYCTCHKEATSARAVLELQSIGFTNVYALLGSLDAWEAADLPTRDVPRR